MVVFPSSGSALVMTRVLSGAVRRAVENARLVRSARYASAAGLRGAWRVTRRPSIRSAGSRARRRPLGAGMRGIAARTGSAVRRSTSSRERTRVSLASRANATSSPSNRPDAVPNKMFISRRPPSGVVGTIAGSTTWMFAISIASEIWDSLRRVCSRVYSCPSRSTWRRSRA